MENKETQKDMICKVVVIELINEENDNGIHVEVK